MKRARTLVLALVLALPALLSIAPLAQAQSASGISFGFTVPGTLVTQTSLPVRVRGQIVVSFHGDGAAGCAAAAVCAYSGTLVVAPKAAALAVLVYRHHGRTQRLAALNVEPGDSGQYLTAARVERSIPGQPSATCADTEVNSFATMASAIRGRALTIGLFTAGSALLSTRCSGPLDADLARSGPAVTVPLARAERGRLRLDLGGTRSFRAHGFAGTISSTLVLTLGRPEKNSAAPAFPPGVKTQQMRTVSEQLSLTRLSGRVSATVLGSSDPIVCRLLDSCGLAGTLELGDTARGFSGAISATGPADRPYRDFLAALGLSTSGDPRGIMAGLFGTWTLRPVTERVSQAGICTDSAPGGVMFLNMSRRRDTLRGPAGSAGWRTRCPGPNLGENSGFSAVLPLSALGRRAFTITVRPTGQVLEDDGYTASLHGRLSLRLRRGRISQQLFTAPTG